MFSQVFVYPQEKGLVPPPQIKVGVELALIPPHGQVVREPTLSPPLSCSSLPPGLVGSGAIPFLSPRDQVDRESDLPTLENETGFFFPAVDKSSNFEILAESPDILE